MFNKLLFRNIRTDKYNSSRRDEKNKNFKNKIENNRSNKDLFKFIRAFKNLMLEFFAI